MNFFDPIGLIIILFVGIVVVALSGGNLLDLLDFLQCYDAWRIQICCNLFPLIIISFALVVVWCLVMNPQILLQPIPH